MHSYSDRALSALSDWSEYERTVKPGNKATYIESPKLLLLNVVSLYIAELQRI